MGAGLILGIALFVGGAAAGPAPRAAVAAADDQDVTDLLGSNAACLVCHMTFLKEEIAKTHLAAKVACVKCHGTSAAHANDEHIGATKPDKFFKRDQVDAACTNCHKEHDVAAQKVVTRFLERKLPTDKSAVCTDCHGHHKIAKAGT